ncbi:hypothetical protein PsorP6_013344 [Peronosclerospora sorghi]|uniref:Uncharacterized protein n=1 Tax=Peronosclerospora sorghi TaxID=230839 RepID=A0ACC0WGJ5_9STRA|nr:hypothetical protein PsorP6_013344 [Peronosclerospora sorghi]
MWLQVVSIDDVEKLTPISYHLIGDRQTTVHESTSRQFESEFLVAVATRREVGSRGSMAASRAANPNKEANDAAHRLKKLRSTEHQHRHFALLLIE